jgi:hypothetical protein
MICWYGTGRTGWECPLRIISRVLLWGLVISGTAALVRYLRGAQRPADRSADEPDYQRLDVLVDLDAAMRPAARSTSNTVLATAA